MDSPLVVRLNVRLEVRLMCHHAIRDCRSVRQDIQSSEDQR